MLMRACCEFGALDWGWGAEIAARDSMACRRVEALGQGPLIGWMLDGYEQTTHLHDVARPNRTAFHFRQSNMLAIR